VTTKPQPSPAKRRQILAGARDVFGEMGFGRASVDLIAARAGVSKATVYNHFEDKQALFVACVAQDTEEMSDGLRACLGEPAGDVEQVLQIIGEKVMGFLLSAPVVALHRHVIAEAARFPDIGQTIFDRGPRLVHEAIASYLERWERNGALRMEDAHAAAVQFVALCQGDLLARARLAILEDPPDAQVRDSVRRAVRTFVRAYRP
jgi:TetR/AcrR family transcriptional regulator, mexJK operon transcriptional repressor